VGFVQGYYHHVGTPLQQQPDSLDIVMQNRRMQRRMSGLALVVHVGQFEDLVFDGRYVAILDGHKQSRVVDAHRVYISKCQISPYFYDFCVSISDTMRNPIYSIKLPKIVQNIQAASNIVLVIAFGAQSLHMHTSTPATPELPRKSTKTSTWCCLGLHFAV